MSDYYDQCRFYAGPNHHSSPSHYDSDYADYLSPRHYTSHTASHGDYQGYYGPGIPIPVPTVAAESEELLVDGGNSEGGDGTNQPSDGVVITVESDDNVEDQSPGVESGAQVSSITYDVTWCSL